MHEMSIAEGILQVVEEAAERQNFNRVKAIFVEIGKLSSVEPQSLIFCFDVIVQGSIAEGARLDIIEIPGAGWCEQCAKTVVLASRYETCPCCHSCQVRPTSGLQMRVKELEVE